MNPSITSFIGVIGSGKDYRANLLVDQGNCDRVDFKDGLISLASDIAGYDIRKDYDWFKHHVVGVHRSSNPLLDGMLHSEWKELLAKHPDLMTGRRLLTRLGTEGMRKRDSNYWVKQFLQSADEAVKKNRIVANADCRFMNEVSAIKNTDRSSSFIFCNYKSPRYDKNLDHASEKLAQALLSLNLEDGQQIYNDHFEQAAKILGEEFKI